MTTAETLTRRQIVDLRQERTEAREAIAEIISEHEADIAHEHRTS